MVLKGPGRIRWYLGHSALRGAATEFYSAVFGHVQQGYLNLLVLITAFTGKWGIEPIIELQPAVAGDGYAPVGYKGAF